MNQETQSQAATTVPYRPFGLIKQLLELLNLEVTHMYEDLIFVEHNAFLLQMGDRGEDLYVWFNSDSVPEERPEILTRLAESAGQLSLNPIVKGMFTVQQNDQDESFQLEFISQSA